VTSSSKIQPWWLELRSPLGPLRIECAVDGFFDTKVIDSLAYSCVPCQRPFNIGLDRAIPPGAPDAYRRAMFSRGIHLGHNLGPPGDVVATESSIAIQLPDADARSYRMVLWGYAIKIYLSAVALAEGILHVKGATVFNGDGGATLLIGRGRGGKSTLAAQLTHHGFQLAGNTHALIRDRHVWAINSWARIRDGTRESYVPPLPPQGRGDGPLKNVVLVDHNERGDFLCKRLDPGSALAFCMQFVAATAAYDLKEDLADIWGEWGSVQRNFSVEYDAMRELLRTCPIYYLSADILAADSCAATVDFLHGG
jgi:hypothetical protein